MNQDSVALSNIAQHGVQPSPQEANKACAGHKSENHDIYYLFIRSFVRSFVYSFIHSFIHSFVSVLFLFF